MPLKIRSLPILLVGIVLGLSVALGADLLRQRQSLQEAAAGAARLQDAEVLIEVLERIGREYVDVIDDSQLFESAIRGVLGELDSHSRYLAPDDYEDIRISTSGNYSGVGLDVSFEAGKVIVVTPLDGTPAQRAGILPGDMLVSVDDILVDEKHVEDTIGRMRGLPGTGVTVDVIREGEDEPLRFALIRSEIRVKTVRSEYLGNGFGYIRLTGFSDRTADDLTDAAKDLQIQAGNELRGVVLDLRNNPGGVLDAAVDIADAFLDRGLIVRGTGRIREARFTHYATPGDILSGVELAVLINGGSASASEIVAGALQENDRARLVGETTFGKGSVQTIIPLSEGRAIKLTTSRYLTPSGRSINGTGIEPDIVVHARNPRKQFGRAGNDIDPSEDEQLQEALRVIGYVPVELSPVSR
ncbi:MAG: S41 family peptidase [Gammaproteobacteria bacterium]|nr:MAG: S41 family peptidase [Gammaproteobacteria bacterium]TDJ45784.1 MAG: S41 family peptidase [Gammaproteobacteria bacterium]